VFVSVCVFGSVASQHDALMCCVSRRCWNLNGADKPTPSAICQAQGSLVYFGALSAAVWALLMLWQVCCMCVCDMFVRDMLS
jgi:hypothetical protein